MSESMSGPKRSSCLGPNPLIHEPIAVLYGTIETLA